MNSAAKCCESPKLPPFPQKIIFPPLFNDSIDFLTNNSILK